VDVHSITLCYRGVTRMNKMKQKQQLNHLLKVNLKHVGARKHKNDKKI
jgi:hypothetical protein